MTPVNPGASPANDLPASRLFVLLLPFISAATATAVLAAVAATVGWFRPEMLVVASVAGILAAVPALFLAFRQRAERSAAQREVANIATRMGGLVESAMDAIITVDASQHVVQFNAAAERVFRWPRNAVLGQHLDVLLPERFRAQHRVHIDRFGQTATTSRGMGARLVLHGLRAGGEEFPVEASISQHEEVGGKFFTVILRDVTDRVRFEEQLARSEARLAGILDSAMDAIITIDGKNHVVLFNRAAEAVFGCPREQALGAPLERFIPERYRVAHRSHVERFGVTGVSSRRMGGTRIVMGLRRNGEEFPIDASISQTTENGQDYFTVILRDVTERWRAEEALRLSREEVRELALAAATAREEEKARFARELHDELGQALTALKIDVGFLRESAAAESDAVRSKLAQMQLLIDGTVTAARRLSSELRPLMLDDLGLVAACDWLVQNFRRRTGIECELVVGADMDLPDPWSTAVFRVLQESLNNATKHSEATQVEVTLERQGNEAILTVHDNGRGFDTGGARKPGTHGLTGLRERASLLNGRVDIQSAPGKGATVELRLPLEEAQ